MTQNYKWYRLLSKKEFDYTSWRDIFKNHGYIVGRGTYKDFAPDLMGEVEIENRSSEFYVLYASWWTRHFGTKLHRHLYGLENVL
jgi:hypothetical protein